MNNVKRKKVLIISYYFNLRDTDRGFSVLNYFRTAGYDVELICGDFDHNSKQKVSYNLQNCTNVPVIRYKKNISIKRIISNIKFAFDVKSLLRNKKFDIAYIISPPNVTGFVNKRLIKVKKGILVLDVFDLYPETIPIKNSIIKVISKPFFIIWAYLRDSTIEKSDIFIGSCNYYFSRLGLKESSKYKIVPLCKNDTDKQSVSNIPLDEIRIVYLGALTGNYDFEGLIRIMIEFKQRKKAAKLYIIGDGHQSEWLKREMIKNNINFDFLGRVYEDKIKEDVFNKCHFGFNGFKEDAAIALSYKSMEYMSNGLALINSCKEDTWNLVETERIGFNYNSNNINYLVNQILNMSEEELNEMKVNSLETYKREFSYSTFSKRMDNIFKSLQVNI